MSRLERWTENRIHQEIYLRQLKQTNALPSGSGLNEVNQQGWNGTSVPLPEGTQDTRGDRRIEDRTRKDRLAWIILCLWSWIHSGHFGR
jgi:hypothetical protein